MEVVAHELASNLAPPGPPEFCRQKLRRAFPGVRSLKIVLDLLTSGPRTTMVSPNILAVDEAWHYHLTSAKPWIFKDDDDSLSSIGANNIPNLNNSSSTLKFVKRRCVSPSSRVI